MKPWQTRKTIWRVNCDTRHFSFEAYGTTKEDAVQAMAQLIRDHATQYSLPPTWADNEDMTFREIEIGAGYRDNEKVSEIA